MINVIVEVYTFLTLPDMSGRVSERERWTYLDGNKVLERFTHFQTLDM